LIVKFIARRKYYRTISFKFCNVDEKHLTQSIGQYLLDFNDNRKYNPSNGQNGKKKQSNQTTNQQLLRVLHELSKIELKMKANSGKLNV
jgi:hypothetical protein